MPSHSTSPTRRAQQIPISEEPVLRELTRSPHPYHRPQLNLPNATQNLSTTPVSSGFPLISVQATDDEAPSDTYSRDATRRDARYSTNSDSGTEADDEHYLKGLPAPHSRPRKGLRSGSGLSTRASSPSPSPAILTEHGTILAAYRRSTRNTKLQKSVVDDIKLAEEKFYRRRRAEVVRRSVEVALLVIVGITLLRDRRVRSLVHLARFEIFYTLCAYSLLLTLYPIRVFLHSTSQSFLGRLRSISIPVAFDPAPLLYPNVFTCLVTLSLAPSNPSIILPNLILSLSSLPAQLFPSIGSHGTYNVLHWFFSCLPLFTISKPLASFPRLSPFIRTLPLAPAELENLSLLYPLHLALCETLHYLTTTSLLPAELQLLSIALINLLMLASSPQATILQSLLWIGGLGVLISCGHVLRWGVALARVPRWRFKNAGRSLPKPWSLLSAVYMIRRFLRMRPEDDTSDDDESYFQQRLRRITEHRAPPIVLQREDSKEALLINGEEKNFPDVVNGIQRRHTIPSLSRHSSSSSRRTPSGRRKRAASSSVRKFGNLTLQQASIRKWLYAGYVYTIVVAIILFVIRPFVSQYALDGNEPIGWALGYLLGDNPWFRMQVMKMNLERWICLPPNFKGIASTGQLGWVEDLRISTIGPANTRLALCIYWLGVIATGLLVVFRLSTIYEVDTRRKVFHFMMVAMFLPSTFIDPTFASLALSLVLAIFLLLDLFRASQLPPLSKPLAYFLTPYVDGRDLRGPVVISHIFLLIGCAIPLWLSLAAIPRSGDGYATGWELPTREVSMVSGIICVGLGDAAASLVGRRYGRHKWFWSGGKSIEGSVAFATAVTLALCAAKAWLRIGGWDANNDDCWLHTIWKAAMAASMASLTEAVLTGGNDNVVVPVVLWLCVRGLDI